MNKTFSKILSTALYPFSPLIKLLQTNTDLLPTYKLKLIIARVLRIIRLVNGTAASVQFPDIVYPSANPERKKKIGVIDHSYHHKTISLTFFIDLLKQIGSVTVMWDSQWDGGKFPSFEQINMEGFDVLILLQIMIYYHPEKLKKLNCKQIIIIPMFDDIHADPDSLFLKFRDFRFVCFCKSLHLRFNQLGLRSKYFQFFIDPSSLPYREDPFTALKGFFWQRTNDITWDYIRKLIEGSSFASFHLHLALDPIWYREVMPTEEEIKKYHITITHWFDKKEDYLDVLSQANIFFTPRLYEGIGMPVIEAMTMGKVVVAPDHPTMNEYISHGKNGLLYDIHDLKPLDFSSAKTIAIQARKDSLSGFENWRNASRELLDFIDLHTQA